MLQRQYIGLQWNEYFIISVVHKLWELCYPKSKNFLYIFGFCDIDWGGDTTDRKSQTRILIYVGGILISWASKKQITVAHFSMEAEYKSIATMVEKMEAVKTLLMELKIQVQQL